LATITDSLITIIDLRGAEAAVSQLGAMAASLTATAASGDALATAEARIGTAQTALLAPLTALITEQKLLTANLWESVTGFGAMATAEGVAAAAAGVLAAALALVLSPLTLVLAGLAAIAGGIALATKGIEKFSESEAVTARLALQMKNLGNVFPVSQAIEFSNRLERLTGVSHNAITALVATAAQFGLTKAQMEKIVPVTLDIAAAKGIDPGEVMSKLLRTAATGQTRGLVGLGIDPHKIKGDLKDIDNLVGQVGKGFAGVAEGFRNTLPGTTKALGSALEHLFEALGRFISPVVLPVLNLMISGIEKLTALLERIANAFPKLFPTAATSTAGGRSDIALKGDPEQTEYLKSIDKNTKAVNDAFVQQILGGTGVVAKSAFTARDARLAFGI
jgi:hypothetical protein